VVCTGIALTVYVAVVSRHGPQLGILVNYTVPAAALAIGAVLLGEEITATRIGGLVLVLVGVGIASGLIRRRHAAASPP
jgi:drug/metabolite transporter (DMT)-like permease